MAKNKVAPFFPDTVYNSNLTLTTVPNPNLNAISMFLVNYFHLLYTFYVCI